MSIRKAPCLRQYDYFGGISGLKDKSVKLATCERREVSVALTSQLADLLNWITASGQVDRKDAWKRYEHIYSLARDHLRLGTHWRNSTLPGRQVHYSDTLKHFDASMFDHP
jgi:hypothetical protein